MCDHRYNLPDRQSISACLTAKAAWRNGAHHSIMADYGRLWRKEFQSRDSTEQWLYTEGRRFNQCADDGKLS
jgi:hypothetical protein